jgi:hypothetical protein
MQQRHLPHRLERQQIRLPQPLRRRHPAHIADPASRQRRRGLEEFAPGNHRPLR